MLSRMLDPCSIARVQSWDVAGTAPTIDQVEGLIWPREVGAVAGGLVDVLCVGPAEWLVIGGNAESGELCEMLNRTLSLSPLRATDVSHAFFRVELEGSDVREILCEGCSLDLHPSHFPIGRCARTRFSGVPIVLRRHEPLRFEGIVASGYREYLQAWIADASA